MLTDTKPHPPPHLVTMVASPPAPCYLATTISSCSDLTGPPARKQDFSCQLANSRWQDTFHTCPKLLPQPRDWSDHSGPVFLTADWFSLLIKVREQQTDGFCFLNLKRVVAVLWWYCCFIWFQCFFFHSVLMAYLFIYLIIYLFLTITLQLMILPILDESADYLLHLFIDCLLKSRLNQLRTKVQNRNMFSFLLLKRRKGSKLPVMKLKARRVSEKRLKHLITCWSTEILI